MSGLPAVTVVVPTHERPALLRRAVASVLQQDYAGEIEVIVVFDACDPDLPDLDPPPSRTLRGISNSRTRGLAGARNSGILAAVHELVAFLDDDDQWWPDKTSLQVEALARCPEAVLVGTAMVVDDGDRLHERLLPGDAVTHEDLLHDRLAGLHASSFLLKRSALLGDLGLVDEALPRSYGEDYDLLLRAAELGPVRVVNRPLVTVDWKGQSQFLGRWEAYAAACEALLAKHPGFATRRRARGRIEAQAAFSWAAAGHRREALAWAARALRHDPRQLKALLAVAVAVRLVTADRVVRAARRRGRGI